MSTPETDELRTLRENTDHRVTEGDIWELCESLERERDEARGQRDMLAEALRECRDDSIELIGERDSWQRESRGDYQERYQSTRDNVTRADAALQSLTTKP